MKFSSADRRAIRNFVNGLLNAQLWGILNFSISNRHRGRRFATVDLQITFEAVNEQEVYPLIQELQKIVKETPISTKVVHYSGNHSVDRISH